MSLNPNYAYEKAVVEPGRERGTVVIEVDYLLNDLAEAKAALHALATRLEVVRRPTAAEDGPVERQPVPSARCELAAQVITAIEDVRALTRGMRALLDEIAL